MSLNSDGSGRVEIEAVIDPCGNAKQENIWQSYRNYLAQIKETLLESEGISAWDEVEWKVLPNGKYYFKGLAFFESINDVAIHLGKFNANLRTFYIADANGNKVLELKSLKSQVDDKSWQKQNSPLRYKLFSSDVAGMLNELRLNVVFNLPAKTEKTEGFENIDEQTIHYLINGKRMTYLLDYIKQNGLYQLAERWNYDKVEFLNNELLPLYLDKVAPLKAYFVGGENLFDYEKEKSNAKQEIIKIIDTLDVEAVKAKIKQQNESKSTIAAEPNAAAEPTVSTESQLRSALIDESKNEYQKAIDIYAKIIKADKAEARYLAQVYYRLGLCYFETGDNEKAIEQFEYVIANFAGQRVPAVRSSNMIVDIRNDVAVRKADKIRQGPAIINLSPELYVQDVSASAVDGITIQFSQPMDSTNWFYSSFAPGELPQVTGMPLFDSTGKNWTLPVKLEPSKVYAIAFNCGDAVNDNKKLKAGFRGVSGKLCKPFVLVFATMNDANEPTDIDVKLIDESTEININD